MKTKLITILLISTLLAACGGGGDDCTVVDCKADTQPVNCPYSAGSCK